MTLPILPRVAAGDPAAVDECLARYGGLVWSLARRLSPDRADAEDAAQDIFIEIWRMAGRFNPAQGSELSFIATLARRRLVDRHRKAARAVPTAPFSEAAVPAPSADGLAGVDLCDEAARAAAELARLRPEERRPLELAIYHGMTHEQIAAATGTPVGTVKTNVRRGLIRLRERLVPDNAVSEGKAP